MFVFVDLANLAAAVAPLSRAGMCRYVVWLHGREVFPPHPGLRGRMGLQSAWKLLASSDYTRQAVVTRYPGCRVSTCEPALERCDVPPPAQSRRRLTLAAVDGPDQPIGDRLILSVGRMSAVERYKGQDWLLRAFPAVCRHVPGAQLMLAGQGDDYPRILAIARALPQALRERVFMPGYVAEPLLEDLYRRSCLFAMPSLKEGFGLVYLEAMSHAKPCVAARAAAAPEVVRHGENGLLVASPPEQLCAALTRLLCRPEEANRMGRAGFEIVRRRHLYPHFRERFLRLMELA
jgi:glycosyltransferase involved in cell wall biosynthesis